MIRVIPSGRPYWSRANAFGNYGGDAGKANYEDIPALGGDTDLDAPDFNRGPTDLAACSRSQVFCVIQFTARDSTTEDPLVNYVALPTGVYLGEPYDGGNPPSGFPTVVRTGLGAHTVTLDATYSDSYGVDQAMSITGAKPTVAALTPGEASTAEKTSSTTLAIETINEFGAPLSNATLTVEIW